TACRKAIALEPAFTGAYRGLARVLTETKDHAGLARTALDLSKIAPKGWAERHRSASYLTGCVALAKEDAKLSQDERKAKVQEYEEAARELLRQAIRQGANVIKDVREAELLPVVEAKQCRVEPQWMNEWSADKWSNSYQLFCAAEKDGHVVLEVTVPTNGAYR